MKKVIALLAAALMLAGVVSGCAGKGNSSSAPAPSSSASVPFSGSSSQESQSSSQSSESSQQSQAASDGFTRGEWKDGVFKSEYLGFSFTLPEGWTPASDEEIAELMQVSVDMLTDEQKFVNEMAKVKIIYDMMATQEGGGPNISIMVENLALSVGGTDYDEQKYSAVVAEQLPQVPDLGAKLLGSSEATIAGEKYLRQDFSAYDGQLTLTYFFRRVDKYMLVMIDTAVTGQEPTADSIVNYFSAL